MPKLAHVCAGRAVRSLRKHAQLTQEELAQGMDTTQSTISRLESGEQNLHILEAFELAHALNIPLSWLMITIETELVDFNLVRIETPADIY